MAPFIQQALDFCQTDPAKAIGYCIVVCTFLFICVIAMIRGKEILNDIRGKNGWQAIEIITIIYTILLTTLGVTDILGLHASTEFWTFMDIIFPAIVAGKVVSMHKNFAGQEKGPSKEEP